MSWWLTDEDRDEEPVNNPVPEQRRGQVADCVVKPAVGRCPGLPWAPCVEVFDDHGRSFQEQLAYARACVLCSE